MRKFTSIATALLLGGFGFAANAAVSSATAVADPVSGTVMDVLPDDFTVSWDGESVALNTESSNYEDWSGYVNIEVYVDGVLYEEDGYMGKNPIYAIAEVGEDGNSLLVGITFSYNFSYDFPGQHQVEFKFPQGVVLLGADSDENAAFSVTYTVGDPSTAVTYLPAPFIDPADGTISYGVPKSTEYSWDEPIFEADEEEGLYVLVRYTPLGFVAPFIVSAEIQDSGYYDENADEYVPAAPYYLVADWSNVIYDSETYMINPGDYTVILPEGMVKNSAGAVNEQIELNYTVYAVRGGEDITPDPFAMDENWNTVTYTSSELSAVTIAFPFDIKAVNPAPAITCTLQQDNGEGGDSGIAPWAVAGNGILDPSLIKVEGNAIILDLSGLTTGTWFIEIPSGYAEIPSLPDTYTNFVEFSYIVDNGELGEPTISPVSGTTLYKPLNVVLEWDEAIYPIGDDVTVNVTYNGVTSSVVADIVDNGAYDESLDMNVPAAPYSLIIDWSALAYNTDLNVYKTGDYTITVPAAVIKNANDSENAEYSVTYTLYNTKGETEITPAPYAVDDNGNPMTYKSSELAAVNIEFPSTLYPVNPQPSVVVTPVSEEEGVAPLADNVLDPSLVSISGNSIILDLSGYGDGDWSVYIPAGFAKIDDTTFTGDVEFIYHINNSNMPAAEVIGGLENYSRYSTENAPTYALVTWDYAPLELGEGTVTATVQNYGSSDVKTIELPADAVVLRYAVPAQEGGEPSVEPAPQADTDDEDGYNALEINFGEYVEGAAGYVAINIPAGMVTSNGTPNPAFTINYDIMPVYDGEATFINVDGEVSVYWGDQLVYVNFDEVSAYVADTNGNEYVLSYESPYFDESGAADVTEIEGMVEGSDYPDFIGVLVRLNNLKLADGSYTLWLPTGFVTIHDADYTENWFNRAAYWQFEVLDGQIVEDTTAIDSIETATPAIEGVYNLQGVKLSNDLNNLAPGLYIINGKKVLVRK